MKFIKKNWSNILFAILIVLLLVPQTGVPIKIYVNRIFSFSPSVTKENNRKTINDPIWKLVNMQGEIVDFNQYKGKKVLINFWATWCAPCIAEMPGMQALYNDYSDKVVFLFVTNEKKSTVTAFLNKHGYNFPVYNGVSQTPEVFFSKSIPTTFLINEQGEILIRKTGAANWNSKKVRSLLD